MSTQNNPKPQSENTVICPVCGLELPAALKKCPQDGVVLRGTIPTDPLVGTVLAGRYEILAVVGRGGMSVVYKARNKAVGSIVAVKTLKHDLISDEELFARFCQEAKAVQLLVHPNIVTVHEFGVTLSGQPFIVMDFLAGHTIGQLIDEQGRIPVKRSLKIFIQVCDALSHAHAHKIIHRDIKPGNIMLVQTATEDDFVKLFDFGFAKLLPQTGLYVQQLTQTGDVLGTPLYMSPEQSRGKSLDSRSDIYSVGCVMYEALTGKAPLVGENVLDTMQKQINERPESLDTARPDLYIPEQLTTILFRCLEKNPDQRYQTMNDLKRDLDLIYSGLSGKVMVLPGMLPGLAKLKQIPPDPVMPTNTLILGICIGITMVIAGCWATFTFVGRQPPPVQEKRTLPTFTGEPTEVWSKYRQAGIQALDRKDYSEAEELFHQSLLQADKTDNCPLHTATNLIDLARTYLREDKLSDAEKSCNKALNIRHSMHETNERAIAEIFSIYAEIYLKRDNYRDADTYLQKALAIQQRELGSMHPDVATIINQLGKASEGEQDYQRAESYYKQAMTIRSSLGPAFLPTAETMSDYARLLRHLNRSTEAEKFEAKAKQIRAASE